MNSGIVLLAYGILRSLIDEPDNQNKMPVGGRSIKPVQNRFKGLGGCMLVFLIK